MTASAPASALTFTLNDTGGAGMGTQARAGFEAAAYYWSSVLNNNANVTLNIGFSSLGGNILGQTGSSSAVALTQDIYTALAVNRAGALDVQAVSSLKALTTVTTGGNAGLKQLAMTVNRTASQNTIPIVGFQALSDRNTRLDADGSGNNVALAVNTANMKALGLTLDANGDPFDTPDGDITFNSDFGFDFDPTDGITTGFSDFIGVAIHEIGHALGFVSGVDIYDYYTYDIAAVGNNNINKQSYLDQFAIGSVLDLFRYSAAGNVDWSTSPTSKYFSINGGVSRFNGNANFAEGVYNGDGDQASHWKAPTAAPFCSGLIGIMNPYLCDSTGAIITGDDLAAFDAMGWNLNFDVLANPGYTFTTAQAYSQYQATLPAVVPEPASWAMMIGGFGLVGGAMRRRQATSRTVAA